VKGRLLLDVVVRKGAAVLELLAGEDQALLIRGDSLLVLDLGLDLYSDTASALPFPPLLPRQTGSSPPLHFNSRSRGRRSKV